MPRLLRLVVLVDLVQQQHPAVLVGLTHPRAERLVRNLLLPSMALVLLWQVDLVVPLLPQSVALDHRKQMLLE
jgi:hypothetical protein